MAGIPIIAILVVLLVWIGVGFGASLLATAFGFWWLLWIAIGAGFLIAAPLSAIWAWNLVVLLGSALGFVLGILFAWSMWELSAVAIRWMRLTARMSRRVGAFIQAKNLGASDEQARTFTDAKYPPT